MDRPNSLVHTPWWVYALFAFLVSRGVRAFQPADVSLYQLAVVPALLTGWGLYDLTGRYGLEIGRLAPWLAAFAVGVAIGLALLRGAPLTGDRARGIIHRPADYTLLPLILLAFGVKYMFAVMGAISPELLREAGFRLTDVGVSGLFAGIFVGKFARYMRAYLAA